MQIVMSMQSGEGQKKNLSQVKVQPLNIHDITLAATTTTPTPFGYPIDHDHIL